MRKPPLPSHCPAIIVQPITERHDSPRSGQLVEHARRVRAAYGVPMFNDRETLRGLMDLLGAWLVHQGIAVDAPRRERVVR